jgi:hypothetical protein
MLKSKALLKNSNIFRTSLRTISNKDITLNEPDINTKLKYDPIKQPEKFRQEFLPTHYFANFTTSLSSWFLAPFHIRMWDTDKDTELGKFQWNSNGAFPNRLANILLRSESLQTKGIMKYFVKRFDTRASLELNKAEEPPKISTNSVFLFKDPSSYLINRRSAERLAVFLLLTQAWTAPAAIMYLFVALYFNVFQKSLSTSLCMVTRMDLLPATEQLHIIKIGMFGFPRSVLVNAKDLIKIEKEEDHLCKNILFMH